MDGWMDGWMDRWVGFLLVPRLPEKRKDRGRLLRPHVCMYVCMYVCIKFPIGEFYFIQNSVRLSTHTHTHEKKNTLYKTPPLPASLTFSA